MFFLQNMGALAEKANCLDDLGSGLDRVQMDWLCVRAICQL